MRRSGAKHRPVIGSLKKSKAKSAHCHGRDQKSQGNRPADHREHQISEREKAQADAAKQTRGEMLYQSSCKRRGNGDADGNGCKQKACFYMIETEAALEIEGKGDQPDHLRCK
jgi:hypothetical protein